MDVDEVTDDMRQKPLWQFEVREREGYRHRMAKFVTGKKQYPRCGKRSIHDKVTVTCYAPMSIQANRRGEAKSKNRWKDRSIGRSSSPDSRGCLRV